MSQDDQTQPGRVEDAFAKPAAEARERQLSGLREHQVKPGQVLNKEGKNGHRARQELVAAILLEDEDNLKAPEPGKSRIRNVVLALTREVYDGGPGAQAAGKTLVEQFAGKARQQLDLSSDDGTVLPAVIRICPAKPIEEGDAVSQEPPKPDGT